MVDPAGVMPPDRISPDRGSARAVQSGATGSAGHQGKRDFVSQSSSKPVDPKAIVVQSGNELDQFVQVLQELAVPVEISSKASLPSLEEAAGASVLVVPGRRLIDSKCPNLSHMPRVVAVVDSSSKTMVAHLNRLGVALVVRRPIHPRTLRLLLLHEIYHGPERRKKKRVLIGHPIRVSAGLFKNRATLLDLSPGGARLDLPNAPKVGGTLKILIGKDLTHTKPLKLTAKVVRCIRPSGENGRAEAEIGVQLIKPDRDAKTIRAILDRYVHGPASWSGKLDPSDSQPSIKTDVKAPETVEAKTSEPAASKPAASKPAKAEPSSSLPPTARKVAKAPRASEPLETTPEPIPSPMPMPEPMPEPEPAPEPTAERLQEPTPMPEPEPEPASPPLPNPMPMPEPEPEPEPIPEIAEAGGQAPVDELDTAAIEPISHDLSESEDLSLDEEFDLDDAPELDFEDEDLAEIDVEAEFDEDDANGDRRNAPRVSYDERVVALDKEAARILVGRDLSPGGMRISSNEDVDIGDKIRIALHCGTELEPLVLIATADRDDGDQGTVLTFQELSDRQLEHLEKIIASQSPIQCVEDKSEAAIDRNEMTGAVVMGEMIETIEKGPFATGGSIETEDQIAAHLDSIFDTNQPV